MILKPFLKIIDKLGIECLEKRYSYAKQWVKNYAPVTTRKVNYDIYSNETPHQHINYKIEFLR